ncbi:carbohydrate ABC transporter substrate-binding protein [Streptomyces sp. NPDC086519]|uniref:carbohydrate ABC transporter substrate-binding protein n=1 Tax=Streptomyces sp. NPDC086519 TaxID=3154863 RepID=UPI0034494003
MKRAPALRGMTWDHPRACLPLEAFEATGAAPSVDWERQSLAEFEAHPIDELAQRYDFMIIDHPGLGAAVAAGALTAYEDLVDLAELHRWVAGSVGASGASYRLGARTWAVPVDAAAQVAVRRPGVPVVHRWEDVLPLAREHPLTLCLAGPHAGLMLLAMCSDRQPADPGLLLDPVVAADAVALLREVFRTSTREVLDPIGVHESLKAGDGPAWCPLTYGYVTYAGTLAWSDAPSWRGTGPLSVLGGTGLAIAARSASDPSVSAWVRAFLDDRVQSDLVPRAGGQPAHRAVWESSRSFYADTLATLEAAWVRPRYPGWITLQDQLSEQVREAVVAGRDPAAAIADVNRRHAALRRACER